MTESQRSSVSDKAFDLVGTAYTQAAHAVVRGHEMLDLDQKWISIKQFAAERPLITLFATVALAMSAIPILCFLAFAIGSLIFMFIVFMFIEGVLLTIGLFVLVGILSVVLFLSVGLSSLIAVAGCLFLVAHKVTGRMQQGLGDLAVQTKTKMNSAHERMRSREDRSLDRSQDRSQDRSLDRSQERSHSTLDKHDSSHSEHVGNGHKD